MKYPFEADYQEIQNDPDSFVTAVFSSLVSEFLVLPKGDGFIDYPQFEAGYEALKKATAGFAKLPRKELLDLVGATPICLIVMRSILGFTPPEWAHVAGQRKGVEIPQGFVRSLDRKVRMEPLRPLRSEGATRERLVAMVEAACELMEEGCPSVKSGRIHRLQKADTAGGLATIRALAAMGAPYAMLLYERFMGRPFAGHRDSVSGLVGDKLESVVEDGPLLDRLAASCRCGPVGGASAVRETRPKPARTFHNRPSASGGEKDLGRSKIGHQLEIGGGIINVVGVVSAVVVPVEPVELALGSGEVAPRIRD